MPGIHALKFTHATRDWGGQERLLIVFTVTVSCFLQENHWKGCRYPRTKSKGWSWYCVNFHCWVHLFSQRCAYAFSSLKPALSFYTNPNSLHKRNIPPFYENSPSNGVFEAPPPILIVNWLNPLGTITNTLDERNPSQEGHLVSSSAYLGVPYTMGVHHRILWLGSLELSIQTTLKEAWALHPFSTAKHSRTANCSVISKVPPCILKGEFNWGTNSIFVHSKQCLFSGTPLLFKGAFSESP